MSNNNGVGCAIAPGSILAAFLSYALNHSILWAILHFFLGWIYIFYTLFFKFPEIRTWVRATFL